MPHNLFGDWEQNTQQLRISISVAELRRAHQGSKVLLRVKICADRSHRPLPQQQSGVRRLPGNSYRYSHSSLTSVSRDEPRRRAVGDIGPKPRDGDCHAVTKAQQKQNVNQTPEPPSKCAMQPDETEVGNCRL